MSAQPANNIVASTQAEGRAIAVNIEFKAICPF
jgi:hypothetical protein